MNVSHRVQCHVARHPVFYSTPNIRKVTALSKILNDLDCKDEVLAGFSPRTTEIAEFLTICLEFAKVKRLHQWLQKLGFTFNRSQNRKTGDRF